MPSQLRVWRRRTPRSSDTVTAPHQDEERPGSGRPPAREQALARRLLVAAGLAYVLAQLALFPFQRPPGWDESVYLSQVIPGTKAMFFMASHARGITLLVAPVTWLGGSIGAVRVFLAAVSVVAMMAAFGSWTPLIGLASPMAAIVFSFSWLSLLGASDVMPNFWAALLGLTVMGLIARRLDGDRRRLVAVASIVLAGMALFRPTEAAVVAGAIGAYIALQRRSDWRILPWLGLGVALGWSPWLIEMSIRFGGPLTALRQAGTSHFAEAPIAQNVLRNLAFTAGSSTATHVPAAGVAWWGLLLAMTVVALAERSSARIRGAALLACFGAAALATEYLVFVSALAPRFLLPAYACVSIPAGIGIVSLLRAPRVGRAAGAAVLALMVPWAAWQATVADRVLTAETSTEVGFRDVGLTMRRLAGGRPCSFLSPHGFPEMQLAAECDGSVLERTRGPSKAELEDLVGSGTEVFVVLSKPAPPASRLSSIAAVPSSGPGKTWFIYQLSDLTG